MGKVGMRKVLRTIAVVLALCTVAFAQKPEEVFDRAGKLYGAGKYEVAAKLYQSILNQGITSAAVYYNLGNCYYRLGKIAPAILSYERANRLAPDDPDILHNLKLVNLKTLDRIEQLPELFVIGWIRSLSAFIPVSTSSILFILSWIVCFGALAVSSLTFRFTLIRITRWTALVTFVLAIFFGALFFVQRSQLATRDEAIVTPSVVTAKSSPDEKSVDAFVIHMGLKVKLSDAVGEWVKITLADGKVGWILASECSRIQKLP